MDISKERLEKLYVKQGLTVRQCAAELGLPTHGGISGLLKKFGISARPQLQTNKFHGGARRREVNKVKVACTQCGIALLRFPSLVHEKNFCNDLCYGAWRSENFVGKANPNYGNSVLVGEKNPNWQGGIQYAPYPSIWGDPRFKAGIRERDNFICQNPECCGGDDKLTIHHIDYDKKNCDPKNLIALCNSCNVRANYNREFWEAGYKEIIRLKYEANQLLTVINE